MLLFGSKAKMPPGRAKYEEGAIYNRIAVLRAERRLTRQSLAHALGINYQTVGYIERGEYNPSLDLAFRISELFALPLEMVFSRKPFRPMSEELSVLSRYGREAPGTEE